MSELTIFQIQEDLTKERARLIDLEQEVLEIQSRISRLENALSVYEEYRQFEIEHVHYTQGSFPLGVSIQDSVYHLLVMNSPHTMKRRDIINAMRRGAHPDIPAKSVSNALFHLQGKKQVERAEEGGWRAVVQMVVHGSDVSSVYHPSYAGGSLIEGTPIGDEE